MVYGMEQRVPVRVMSSASEVAAVENVGRTKSTEPTMRLVRVSPSGAWGGIIIISGVGRFDSIAYLCTISFNLLCADMRRRDEATRCNLNADTIVDGMTECKWNVG